MGEARTDELSSASAFESAKQIEPSAETDSDDHIDERVINSTFGAYSMWSDEETRFAPIDIEATPLDEPATAKVDNEAGPLERGFEFAPVASEAPAASQESAADPAAAQPAAVQPTELTERRHHHSHPVSASTSPSGTTCGEGVGGEPVSITTAPP